MVIDMRRVVLFAVAVTFAVGVSSCGQVPSETTAGSTAMQRTGTESPDSDESAVVERQPPLTSPDLRVTVDPTAGPPGTVIHIEVSGCNDPTGLNHAVSFNNDPDNFAVRFAPQTVHAIESSQDGERLTAEYTVVDSDRAGKVGRVYVQCSDGLATAEFAVTE